LIEKAQSSVRFVRSQNAQRSEQHATFKTSAIAARAASFLSNIAVIPLAFLPNVLHLETSNTASQNAAPAQLEISHHQCYIMKTQHRGRIGVLMEDSVLSVNTDAATAADQGSATMTGPNDTSSDALLAFIMNSLEEDKAEDIVQIDLRGKSAIGDYMLVCSGRSTRQVVAISEKLQDKIKQDLGRASKLEGKGSGDWVLLDTGDIIVHVFRPEVREFYQIEKMWMGGEEPMPRPTS
jgi:ribosome-associated protein